MYGEINAFIKAYSAKHRQCYKIIKYILAETCAMPNYHVKTVALHHNITCSNPIDDCIECVLEIFEELLRAYETGTLKHIHESNINIFSKIHRL